MKIFILVYNPLSGDAGFKNRLDKVIGYLKAHQCLVLPLRTDRKEDTLELAVVARIVAADGILVAGGDGTLHEVINVMLNAGIDLPVGIIPSGTCNDFATNLKISSDLEECLRLIIKGTTRSVDMGKVNDSYFLNVASAGLFTSVAHNTETPLKNSLGRIAYYIGGLGQLPNFNSYQAKIVADGQLIEEEILLFLVMNSGMVGSFPRLAPLARVDDGKLDVIIVSKCSIAELMGLFVAILAGNHINRRYITYLQAASLHIECDANIESDLDGEPGPRLPLTIETVSKAVRFFAEVNSN